MVSRSVTCSWCGTIGVLVRSLYCLNPACGHRVDLPRMECDCDVCKGFKEKELEADTRENTAIARFLREVWGNRLNQ